jgi:hypothetical protein
VKESANSASFQDFILMVAIHTLAKLWIAAILMKSQKSEIFQVGKRNIQNQKMIDVWGNAIIALPHHF